MEHPCHRVVADGGLEGVQGRPVPQVEGLLPTPKAFPSGGRWAGPPGWFWWRVPSEALGWGCRRQVVRLGPAQVSPCEVVPRPVPGGGSRLSLEKARTQRVAGGYPPPPLFYGPLVPTRSFWRLWHIVPVVGLFRCPSACPDLDSHFAGAGVGRESFSLRRHTTYEGFPLGGSCHRR